MCQRLRAPSLKWISDRRRSLLCSPPTAVNVSTCPEKISATLLVRSLRSVFNTRTRRSSHKSQSLDSVSAPLAVEAHDLERVYASGTATVAALAGVTLAVRSGEFVAVMGPSGSGKSTLLNVIAGLERPTGGTIRVGGEDLTKLDEQALARHRSKRVGMVFQAFNLLPRYRVVENVALPLAFAGTGRALRLAKARALLERLGMSARAEHRTNELSGGELQRAAIARALVSDPAILLADEPTGNLDSANGAALIALFKELHAQGQTVLLVTHDATIAAHAERTVRMRDGRMVD
ncbi:MAG: ABC transporter ATP-binding protein [Chloroflexi bacterium]|nr:MAG: ABC transporter ATP-binding protein [Chloroflexota bacterium]